jgi:excisionase family DNA binding protein
MSLLTVHEAASLLRVSELTIRRWIWAGKLPATRLGRLVRIRPADLESLSGPAVRQDVTPDPAPRAGSPAALLQAARDIAPATRPQDIEELERLIARGCERPGEIGSPIG